MASTYSSLKIELIGTGDQAGTWGATTNTNLGTAIEQAITGTSNVTFASSNAAIALTDTNASQTARALRLNLLGTITNVQTLFVPAIAKQYLITNGLSNSVIISNGTNAAPTGTTFTLPAGRSTIVFNDAVNIVDVVTFASTLGNVTITGGTANALILSNVSIVSGNINNITSNASTFSNVTINGGTSNGLTETNVTINTSTINNPQVNAYTEGITTGYVNTGSTYTLNIANSTIITANLSATCTVTMPANTAGKSFVLMLKTGAGTNTATFTGVRWNNGNTAPTITATANRLDILTFVADGNAWYGSVSQNYAP